jgi:Uma2 family endonuclease
MTRAIKLPPPPDVEYPDSDSHPMSDNTLQFKWIVVIEENLEALCAFDPYVFVAGDLLWYPVQGHLEIRTAPDAMVVFGRPNGRRGSYKQWEQANIPPQVVFEVLSPGNRQPELDAEFEFYDRHGVLEYYTYDPDDGSLAGWVRTADRLQATGRMDGIVSPRLRIRFEPGPGPDNLVISRADRQRFLTFTKIRTLWETEKQQVQAERQQAREARERADAEQRRAAEQRQFAAQQRQFAAQQRQRALRLAAKLRELGIEPD